MVRIYREVLSTDYLDIFYIEIRLFIYFEIGYIRSTIQQHNQQAREILIYVSIINC